MSAAQTPKSTKSGSTNTFPSAAAASTASTVAPSTAPPTTSNEPSLPQPPNDGQLWLRGAMGTPPSKKIVTTKLVPTTMMNNSSDDNSNNNNNSFAIHVIVAPAMAESLAKKIIFDPRGCFIDIVSDEQAFGPVAIVNLSKQPSFQKDSCFRLVRSGANNDQNNNSTSTGSAWPQGLSEIPLKAASKSDRTEWIRYLVDLGAMARGEASTIAMMMGGGGNSNSTLPVDDNRNNNNNSGQNTNTNNSRRSSRLEDGYDDYDDAYFDDEEEEEEEEANDDQQQQQRNNNNQDGNQFGSITSDPLYGSMSGEHSLPVTQPLRPPPPYTLVIPQIKIEDTAQLQKSEKEGGAGGVTNTSIISLSSSSANTSITMTPPSIKTSTLPPAKTQQPKNNNNNNKALGAPTGAMAQGVNQTANVVVTSSPVSSSSGQQNDNIKTTAISSTKRRQDSWPKVSSSSTPIYRQLRTSQNAELWEKNHSTVFSYSDRSVLPPVDWVINNNNNIENENDFIAENDEDDPSLSSSNMPSLDTISQRACLEALHSASSILFHNSAFSTTTTTTSSSTTMTTHGDSRVGGEQQRLIKERQLALQRQQKLAFGIPWNEDQETIKRALERVQLSSVDIAYDLIRKARHSCDDPRKKPVKCVAVLCDLNRISSLQQLQQQQQKQNSALQSNNIKNNRPVFVVQAGQAGLQITDEAVICRGPSFDFSCKKSEIRNVEGGSGDFSSNALKATLNSFSCASSMGSILEQISLNEFTKWVPESEYSFLFSQGGGGTSSDQQQNKQPSTITELPSTIIVRVAKKQINTQLQKQFSLNIEEETDLHLILMFKWPVRADTAARALNDFWLLPTTTTTNISTSPNPIPQRASRVNQHGISLYDIFEKELLPLLEKTENDDESNNNISLLLKKRQSEREPDFESMQKWTMLDFYQAKRHQF